MRRAHFVILFMPEMVKEITPLITAAILLQQNPRSLISAFTVSKHGATIQRYFSLIWVKEHFP
jgi:hypothetical protein